jgi:uncharacterized integral membrane protein
LREHHAQGRLDVDEFKDRIEKAYTAKTLGDLDTLMNDLPEQDLYQLPVPAEQQAEGKEPASRGARAGRAVWKGVWVTWAAVSLINVVIWLLVSVTSMQFVYPWWIWVAGPWGAVLLAGQLMGAPPPVSRRRERQIRRSARRQIHDRHRY